VRDILDGVVTLAARVIMRQFALGQLLVIIFSQRWRVELQELLLRLRELDLARRHSHYVIEKLEELPRLERLLHRVRLLEELYHLKNALGLNETQ
jgi:hypothetical protein